MPLSFRFCRVAAAALLAASAGWADEPDPAVAEFHGRVAPLLENYCYDCHGGGFSKGHVAFDEVEDRELTRRPELWFAALRNLRAGLMPPAGEARPSPAETEQIARWIKYRALGVDPANPDPGRVTIRRLNRVEYGRTIRTLLGVDFPSEAEFPPDDTGHGFDNIGDVLSMSPLLMEKYLQAAETVVTMAVPQTDRITPVELAAAADFVPDLQPAPPGGSGGPAPAGGAASRRPVAKFDGTAGFEPEGPRLPVSAIDPAPRTNRTAVAALTGPPGSPLPFTAAATAVHVFSPPRSANYRLAVDLAVKGPFNFDPARCQVTVLVDGRSRFSQALGWTEHQNLRFETDVKWNAGPHALMIAVAPLPPAATPSASLAPAFEEKQRLEIQIAGARLTGPFGAAAQVRPSNYLRFFPHGEPPPPGPARRAYAREILADFAGRAYRRPADAATVNRLADLAERIEAQSDGQFEIGIARAMMAVLASPHFLFRIERSEPADAGQRFPRVDEYSLASRLSYFFWSSMPDARLFALAQHGQLRPNLRSEIARLLADPKAAAFVHNFTGQWLEARDIETVPINARAILGLPPQRKRGEPRVDFDSEIRGAMREETERAFAYVVRNDRSVLELVDADYTFLNDKLAKAYGVPGVAGGKLRRVTLPLGSPRGGVLTEGTFLAVTSNPTRTSPVKRGQFILENILGTPTPPPPPNIPPLEAAAAAFHGRDPTLREMLAVHRANPLCASCHARMDSLGLAFENFNPLGSWREKDAGQAIVAGGQLITGERFASVRDLKRIITHERRADFYRCLSEKLLTYALGRGLESYDVETVDRLVSALEESGGRISSVLIGIVESAPFQRRRVLAPGILTAQIKVSPPGGQPLNR